MLAGCQAGEFCEKPIFKMADTNLMKNCSVLFSMTISGLDILILCLGEALNLLEIERQQKTFIMCCLCEYQGKRE